MSTFVMRWRYTKLLFSQYYLSAGGIVLVEVQAQLFVCILNHRYLVIDRDAGLLDYSYCHQFHGIQ